MKQLAENLWIFDGEAVPFFHMPYTTRMTVIRLASGLLWVHSPIKLSAELRAEIDTLGQVGYLIAPNHLHHLFIGEWQTAFPESKSYGTQEVLKKRADLSFDAVLTSDGVEAEWPWQTEIEQEMFTGSPAMQECVFFHKASSTLIVTDLIENFSAEHFNAWQRIVAKMAGILAPNGKMPIDWRLSFFFSKNQARQHVKRILAWKPQKIVMSHGVIVEQEAEAFLKRSFPSSWMV